MTELEHFRSQLRAAVQRDIDRGRSRRRAAGRVLRVAAPILTAAATMTAVVAWPGGGAFGSSERARLAAATSALSPPADTILHYKVQLVEGQGAPQTYELWLLNDSFQYRFIKDGQEVGSTSKGIAVYRADSNTISMTPYSVAKPSSPDPSSNPQPIMGGPGSHPDIVRDLHSALARGSARLGGSTSVGGIPAYEITVSRLPRGWTSGLTNGTYYVRQGDYRPLRVVATAPCTTTGVTLCSQITLFTTYETLPATPANLELLNVIAQHPGARLVS